MIRCNASYKSGDRTYQVILQEGREEERELALQRERSLILRQLTKKVGELPEATRNRVSTLSFDQLELLGENLLDFTTLADLETWLAAHR